MARAGPSVGPMIRQGPGPCAVSRLAALIDVLAELRSTDSTTTQAQLSAVGTLEKHAAPDSQGEHWARISITLT